jgi:hypothetical protein
VALTPAPSDPVAAATPAPTLAVGAAHEVQVGEVVEVGVLGVFTGVMLAVPVDDATVRVAPDELLATSVVGAEVWEGADPTAPWTAGRVGVTAAVTVLGATMAVGRPRVAAASFGPTPYAESLCASTRAGLGPA